MNGGHRGLVRDGLALGQHANARQTARQPARPPDRQAAAGSEPEGLSARGFQRAELMEKRSRARTQLTSLCSRSGELDPDYPAGSPAMNLWRAHLRAIWEMNNSRRPVGRSDARMVGWDWMVVSVLLLVSELRSPLTHSLALCSLDARLWPPDRRTDGRTGGKYEHANDLRQIRSIGWLRFGRRARLVS